MKNLASSRLLHSQQVFLLPMANARAIESNTKNILVGSGKAPATCGELLQGQFSQDEDFLVTLPINWYSNVSVSISSSSKLFQIYPNQKSKTKRAVQLLLHHLDHSEPGVEIRVESTIPEGKGLGSSTADITAACRALGDALDESISPELISTIAREIEPSDGSMYTQSVCYNHRKCRLIEGLGQVPPCSLLIVDLGGEVNTVDFNQRPKDYSDVEWKEYHELFGMLKAAFQNRNLAEIASVSTRSARINQRLLHKSELEKIIQIAVQNGGYGICAAHSGTIIGLIFDKNADSQISRSKGIIQNETQGLLHFYTVDSI